MSSTGKDTNISKSSPHSPSAIYNALRPSSIRLLDLKAWRDRRLGRYGLKEVSLQHLPSFVAVSYRWQIHLEDVAILLNDLEFSVKSNVFDCLLSIAEDTNNRYVWIDSICINQSDIEERSSQVNLMGPIYNRADHVLVWLGNASPELSAAFDILDAVVEYKQSYEIEHIADHRLPQPELPHSGRKENRILTWVKRTPIWTGPHELPPDAEIDRMCQGLQALVRLDYWQRTWIIQEIRLAKKVCLMLGSRRALWSKLDSAMNMILLHPGQPYNLNESFQVKKLRNASVFVNALLTPEKKGWDEFRRKMDFLSILRRYRNSKCSDVRDKIYGLLSVDGAGTLYGLKANYEWTTEELLVTAAVCSYLEVPGLPGSQRALSNFELLQSLLSITACDHPFIQWMLARVSSPSGMTKFQYTDGSILCLPVFCEGFHLVTTVRATYDLEAFVADRAGITRQLERIAGAQMTANVAAYLNNIAAHRRAWERFLIDTPTTQSSTKAAGKKHMPQTRRLKLFLGHNGSIGVACPSIRVDDIIYLQLGSSGGSFVPDEVPILYLGPNKNAPVTDLFPLVVGKREGRFQMIGRAFFGRRRVVLRPLPERKFDEEKEMRWWEEGPHAWIDMDVLSLLALSSPIPQSILEEAICQWTGFVA